MAFGLVAGVGDRRLLERGLDEGRQDRRAIAGGEGRRGDRRRGPPARGGARAAGHAVGEQVAPRQRAHRGADARRDRDQRRLHHLVPRRLARRGRGGGTDRARAPVRAPDVHADQGTAGGRVRPRDRGGGRQLQRHDLLRLHRVHRQRAARRAGARRGHGGRPHGQPGARQAAGRHRTRRRRRGAAGVGRGQRRRQPRRAHVQAVLPQAPLPLAGHGLDEGHQGGHRGQGDRVLPALLQPGERDRGDRRPHRRGGDARRAGAQLRRAAGAGGFDARGSGAGARARRGRARNAGAAGARRSAGRRVPGAGPGRRRSGGVRAGQRDPARRAVVADLPATGHRARDGVVRARRRRADPRPGPLRHLGAADQGSHRRRGRGDHPRGDRRARARAGSRRRARQGQGAPRDRVLARAHVEPRARRDGGPVRDRLRRLSPPVPARRRVCARDAGRRARGGGALSRGTALGRDRHAPVRHDRQLRTTPAPAPVSKKRS